MGDTRITSATDFFGKQSEAKIFANINVLIFYFRIATLSRVIPNVRENREMNSEKAEMVKILITNIIRGRKLNIFFCRNVPNARTRFFAILRT